MPGSHALSLDELRQRYPWSDEALALGKPLEWLWLFELPVRPEQIWRLIVDNSRLNRALGLGIMELEEKGGVLHGRASYGGKLHEWTERGWDWVAGRYQRMVRDYTRGYGHQTRLIYHLAESADGVLLHVYFGWIPRGWLGAQALKIGMRGLEKDYRRVIPELASEAGEPRPQLYSHPTRLEPERLARVHGIRDQLTARGLDAAALDKLAWHVATGDDLDIYRIQVRAMAQRWGIDADALLRACLHATRAGLLQMSWDVICPHCRGVREEARTLGDVPERGGCAVCDIDFDTDQENALEITFHVHPSIREVDKVYYCSAEPSTKTHVHVQQASGPGADATYDTRLEPGRYRLRLRGDKRYRYLEVAAEGPPEVAWRVSDDGNLRSGPHPRVHIINDTDQPHTFVIEETGWSDDALRPVHLFNFQDFRDLFSEEYVATDTQLSVGEQTILFTDIVGSTRFYVDRGDPGAFMEVKRHFAEVYDIVKRHRGAVVKTIGDAAMGAFSSPIDALEAARAIHACFHAERADTPVRLRISLNTGPCIAVNLNSNIDYFGNAVNLAAKLQSCAEAGDIALSDAVHQAPGVAAWLEQQDVRLEPCELTHSAFPAPVKVHRWVTFG